MAKTSSILNEAQWRKTFGNLIEEAARIQSITSAELGRQVETAAGFGGLRSGDITRYRQGRIPTPRQLGRLAAALRIPDHVFRICAGYVDEIFCCVSPLVSKDPHLGWPFRVSPKRAAIAFLFSLFPSNAMNVGRGYGSIDFWWGSGIGLNITEERGLMTGEHWNSSWLYPQRLKLSALKREISDRKKVTLITMDNRKPRYPRDYTYFSVRAELQVDIASRLGTHTLTQLPQTSVSVGLLEEARRILHRREVPLLDRIGLATSCVHIWANALDPTMADEVRRHVHPWVERTISRDVVKQLKKGPLTHYEQLFL